MGKHHTEDYKLSAVKYALRTDSQVETCKVFDCKRSSLQDWLKLYEETGSPFQKSIAKVKRENYNNYFLHVFRSDTLLKPTQTRRKEPQVYK